MHPVWSFTPLINGFSYRLTHWQSWLLLLSYMIMVSNACVHAILLKLKWELEHYYFTGSPHVCKRGILLTYFALHTYFICWLTMFKGWLCLGEEATTLRQGPSPLWSYSTDPGPGSLQCLFWCVSRLGGHSTVCVWIDSSVGPLSWSSLGYVGLLLL